MTPPNPSDVNRKFSFVYADEDGSLWDLDIWAASLEDAERRVALIRAGAGKIEDEITEEGDAGGEVTELERLYRQAAPGVQ